jgi:hypothetical protein
MFLTLLIAFSLQWWIGSINAIDGTTIISISLLLYFVLGIILMFIRKHRFRAIGVGLLLCCVVDIIYFIYFIGPYIHG